MVLSMLTSRYQAGTHVSWFRMLGRFSSEYWYCSFFSKNLKELAVFGKEWTMNWWVVFNCF
jgi:hypothetical protein